jgi:hypothetical protein
MILVGRVEFQIWRLLEDLWPFALSMSYGGMSPTFKAVLEIDLTPTPPFFFF